MLGRDVTIFEKIFAGEVPADILYKDDLCCAFYDSAPQAPVHILLVPKTPIIRIAEINNENTELMGHLMCRVPEVARLGGVDQEGYRVVINNGKDGGESVPHLHIHILGGRKMAWPPG